MMKQLKIKTGVVTRLIKDTAFSVKEIESQQARIQKVKDDPEKDDHDVRKQEEVLQEYVDGQTDEFQRLLTAYDGLKEYLVRPPALPYADPCQPLCQHCPWADPQSGGDDQRLAKTKECQPDT